MNYGNVKDQIVVYLRKTGVADFVLNTTTDILGPAVNAARRIAERRHEFKLAEATAFVTDTGSASGVPLSNATLAAGSMTVTGTLSPNVIGTWPETGIYNGVPFYTITVSSVLYFLFYTGAFSTGWRVRPGAFSGSNGWNLVNRSPATPVGAYAATGTSTGTLTVAGTTSAVSIRRIQSALVPIGDLDVAPLEILTSDEWVSRVRRQIGRQAYNIGASLADLGVTTNNPFAILQGGNIATHLDDAGAASYPITLTLNVVRWMPDYSADADTDFFTQFGADYLLWQAVLEVNKYFRAFEPRQEGNIDEDAIGKLAETALAELIKWDTDTIRGSSTPDAQEE